MTEKTLQLECRLIKAQGTRTSAETDVVFLFQDGDKRPVLPDNTYSPLVDRVRKGKRFEAKLGSTLFLRFGGRGSVENCLLVGLGQASSLTEEKLRVIGGLLLQKIRAEKTLHLALDADLLREARGVKVELAPAAMARALSEGLMLAAYDFLKYKTDAASKKGEGTPRKLTWTTNDAKFASELTQQLKRAEAVASSVNVARDWSNEPSNFGTPEYFANQARSLARQHGLTCRVLTERDAAREKMGLFLGVGQGSVREGRIVVLEYQPKAGNARKSAGGARSRKTIALVGKGITFDSGGISIKPGLRMEEMKHDMSGAATIMGAMILAARWQIPNRLIAILAFTENMPDGDAIQPGNVLISRSKKTVEIINTDAEGRLILADVLDYAQDFKPDAIIDVATLTGAVSIALGKHCCAVLGNDESLIEKVRKSGEKQGERIWQLPLFDEYFDDLRSDCADLKNSANDGYGGTIRGAIFLKQFIRKGVPWAHLDIAATANHMGHIAYHPKRGASGAYVRALAQFAADFTGV